MIRNEHQLRVAQRKLRDLERSIEASVDPVDREQYSRLVEDLQKEIGEYEAIRAGVLDWFKVSSLDDVVEAAIKARIAKGWTQAQLAERLGVSEQQVQKDEASGYARAGWVRVADVVDALGYELVGELRPSEEAPSPLTTRTAPAEERPTMILIGPDITWFETWARIPELESAPQGPAARNWGRLMVPGSWSRRREAVTSGGGRGT